MCDGIMTIAHTPEQSPGVIYMGSFVMADYPGSQVIKPGEHCQQENDPKQDGFQGDVPIRK
jgi:hypothetical protein